MKEGVIWEVQDILCQWENYQGKTILYAFEKMVKMYTFQLKIQRNYFGYATRICR